ncbi:hypothetical protein COLO4_34545 [Corchorus olitorius]|uniref:Uncharacterized protein n=1 Tax=Corchorus olitorius TaxID=93759 RepID=A0A1R3GKE6_9ROSI|nr:hypothetical protein COLO4_34545 [Corchorus olitorius]
MGTLAAEMCAPYCLPLTVAPLSDAEAEWAYILLKEFIKCLTPKAVKATVLPAIQKILQANSFVRDVWNQIGKQAYLETIHPLVISNLYNSPHKSSAAAASVLLICSSEELGVPITVHQTILPLIHCFGKGLCPDGIDVLVRIGGLLGETFIVRQMLPLLNYVARSCIDVSCMNKPEPVHSWSGLALIDSLLTLDGLVAVLPREVVVKHLIEANLEITVLQVAATTLLTICQRIGPELTALHVLPQLKELFDELAFSQESLSGSGSLGESSRSGNENVAAKVPALSKKSITDYSPAKLLLNGVGWSIPQSQGVRVRAHQGALRSLAVCQDENTVFTAGIGPGFKGTVQKWDLTRINCVSGYYGHEEVVNDICLLSSSGRIASCDGTIHVWNSQTGKLISIFSEPSTDSLHLASPTSSQLKMGADHVDMLNSNTLSSAVLSSPFDGSLYTCMHYLEPVEKLVVGTGHGSLRFIDVSQGRKLHLWSGESNESAFPSLVSSICSCGSDKEQGNGGSASPRWIAAGLSSGHCRLFDMRSGNVIAHWRGHDGYVTKLGAPEEHLLVSSSLDRTLKIWDLRRNIPMPITYRGHSDGVSGFSVWGQDVISISRNKIGLSSLAKCGDEIYAWIGCNSAKLGLLYAAAPTPPSNSVSVTSILGGASDNTGSGIARRLVLKTGVNVIVACNIPKNSPMLEANAEKKLVEKLIALGYSRPNPNQGRETNMRN